MFSLFTLLNLVSLTGWMVVLSILVSQSSLIPSSSTEWTNRFFEPSSSSFPSLSSDNRLLLIDTLLFLEGICFIEVGRIAIGQLKGNLALGVVLHMIRMTCLLMVLPNGLVGLNHGRDDDVDSKWQELISMLVLYSWALTEIGRYPMYLFPSSSTARYVRLVLPLVTFPIGAFAEALGAYRALKELVTSDGDGSDTFHLVKIVLLGLVVLVNSVLGPTMAYPALLKKGLPALLGNEAATAKRKKKNE
jgi:hypothetical protein|eukprot:g6848.t1 g6848   contig23:1341083-1341823(-)